MVQHGHWFKHDRILFGRHQRELCDFGLAMANGGAQDNGSSAVTFSGSPTGPVQWQMGVAATVSLAASIRSAIGFGREITAGS